VTELDLTQHDGIEPAQFAAMIKSASKAEIEALLAGPHRGPVLAAIFGRMPGQFRADRAGSTNTVIRWNITEGPAGTDTYAVVIADGGCTISTDPELEAKVSLTLNGYNFLQLISGNADPMMLFMTGKVKIAGNVTVAASVANLFDLPKG
jgi:putative sterol carrier protein